MTDAKKVEYTAEQKEAVLKRAKELGNVKKAAEEAGISWQLVSRWRKEADPSATKAAQAEKKRAEASRKGKKNSKGTKSKTASKKTDSKAKAATKSTAKASSKTR